MLGWLVGWLVGVYCGFFCVVAVFVVGMFDGRLVAGMSMADGWLAVVGLVGLFVGFYFGCASWLWLVW